ncbi:hypothetical protein CEXT_74001, partial [Caerostris extrusa]
KPFSDYGIHALMTIDLPTLFFNVLVRLNGDCLMSPSLSEAIVVFLQTENDGRLDGKVNVTLINARHIDHNRADCCINPG